MDKGAFIEVASQEAGLLYQDGAVRESPADQMRFGAGGFSSLKPPNWSRID